jgi:hypothetical protein
MLSIFETLPCYLTGESRNEMGFFQNDGQDQNYIFAAPPNSSTFLFLSPGVRWMD